MESWGASEAPARRLVDHVHAHLASEASWRLTEGEFWCSARPAAAEASGQGWKLHVSATPASVEQVLDRVVPVLRTREVPFKFVRTPGGVRWLTGRDCGRAEFGKVITIYPGDDTAAAELASELHRATEGLDGPRILSDQPYLPGSLVHYRYGGFDGHGALDDDGVYRYLLRTPDGGRVEDRREARFTPPSWAVSPFPAPAEPTPEERGQAPARGQAPTERQTPTRGQGSGGVLLGGRYLVRQAIRHSAKGGVYLAEDRETGSEVVVKQARAHAESDGDGQDARDRLRGEAATLRALQDRAPVPRLLQVFEQDGDAFLAEQRLPGQPLRTWVLRRSGGGPGVPIGEAVPMMRRLVALVARVHEAGFVLRDLSPTNVLVADGGALSVIDLELAGAPGAPVRGSGTPAYQAPEIRRGQDRLPVAVAEDLFSLGALTFLVATGNDPVLPSDGSPERPIGERLDAWLAAVGNQDVDEEGGAQAFRPLIRGLLAEGPEKRWGLDRARTFLSAWPDQPDRTVQPDRPALASRRRAPVEPPAVPEPDRLLADGLDELVASFDGDRPDRPWPAGAFGAQTDPGNVQHGVAGVLGVLIRAIPVAADIPAGIRGGPSLDPGRLTATVRSAARWLANQKPPRDPSRPLPGLYFGRAGAAWALADAGVALDDPSLTERAVEVATSLPLDWPNPDVAHGLAGAGMAHLHVWRRTAEEQLLERAVALADAVVAAARPGEAGPLWTVPADSGSRLAGACHYGFAHGVAGIGSFLLAIGQATGDPVYADLTDRAGSTLAAAARIDPGAAGPVGAAGPGRPNGVAAWWSTGPESDGDGSARWPHWCSGSSGVGTYLLRLGLSTGRQRYVDLARAAARAVYRARWQSLPAACHGLAGNGQFLLDLAHQLPDDPVSDDPVSGDPVSDDPAPAEPAGTYRAWAGDLAELIAARACRRDGRFLAPDETGKAVVADYNVGLAGVVDFLLRLRHGGPRPWMVDAPSRRPAVESLPALGLVGR